MSVDAIELAKFFQESGIDFILQQEKKKPLTETASCLNLHQCNSITALRKLVENFDGCQLKKTSTNTVFADGNPNAKIMIIGEAPGLNEDKEGIPFCGRSGKLLDKMFEAIGLTRNEIYITNMVFWRPPGNRNPTAEELEVCKPFVEKHIALINPLLVVLAGSFATYNLLKLEQGISKVRGKFYAYTNQYMEQTTNAIPIFHPSYLLRQPKQKMLAWQDLQMIQKHLTSFN